jgi:hypothetical protein
MQNRVEGPRCYQKVEDGGCNAPDHRAGPAVRGSLKRREEETNRSGSVSHVMSCQAAQLRLVLIFIAAKGGEDV